MSLNTIKILVTGANGFLGSNLLKAYAQHNMETIAACRDKNKLPDYFKGEVREGDLRDPAYIKSVVKNINVICHTGTWASMWNHAQCEQENFYNPTINLMEHAIDAGVERFIMTSTVAIAQPGKGNSAIDDFAKPSYTGFWPHLDYLVDVDTYMKKNAHRGMKMINLRLGHFVGAGNKIGLVPALVPRLKTYLVPWLAGGKSRLPLVADTDLANSFIAATVAESLQPYESFNICGSSFPTTREVVEYIAKQTGAPMPFFNVPFTLGYLFAWLTEKLFPILPGKAPFLTRSIVHLAEDWQCTTYYAEKKLGYRPQKNWETALDEALAELKSNQYPWPSLAQK